MERKKWVGCLMGFLGIMGLMGCHTTKEAQAPSATSKDSLSIVTSFYPVYEMTKAITGNQAQVSLLVEAGAEAHSFEPTAKDLAKITEADVFVYHHAEMETWVKKWLNSAKNTKKSIRGTDQLLLLPAEEVGHNHDETTADHQHELDPHTWLAPSLAIKEVKSIERQLSTRYPAKKAEFKQNSQRYVKKLKRLDEAYTKAFQAAKQQKFVTQHTAFRYLAVEYGLEQVAISGLNPEDEPSAKRLAEIQTYVKANHVKTIFMEANARDKLAKTVAAAADVKIEVLHPIENVTNAEKRAGVSYLGLLEENLKALKSVTETAPSTKNTPESTESVEKTVYNGYFNNQDVKDRPLSNYQGSWQSVYPLLQDGTLDQVFSYKSKLDDSKSAAEYYDYYQKGYETELTKLKIGSKQIEYQTADGKKTVSYRYAGYKILEYAKGNRGVRYLYTATTANAGPYKYLQFSDHGIKNQASAHFHLFYGGESHDKLFAEMDHWPTFYPSQLNKWEIAQEMLAH